MKIKVLKDTPTDKAGIILSMAEFKTKYLGHLSLSTHINIKAFIKAFSYTLIPTLGFFFVLVGFLSWEKFVVFVTSDDSTSVFVRIYSVIAEVIIFLILYFYYLKEEIFHKKLTPDREKFYTSKGTRVSDLFKDGDEYKYGYAYYRTEDSDIIIIERETLG